MNPTRAENWQRANVGVGGGIPSGSWTQCGSTLTVTSVGGNVSVINNALANCGPNQYVLLAAGTYSLSGGIETTNLSNVVLRGSGPTQTIIQSSGQNNCGNGRGTIICILGGGGLYVGGGQSGVLTPPCGGSGASNCFNLATPIAKGATSITISNVGSAGIHNGDQITIDQQNDTTDTNGFFVCDTLSPTICHHTSENPSGNGRIINNSPEYSQQQYLYVVSGCSSTCAGNGPFTLTISPPIDANNWDGHVPVGGWFVGPAKLVGIENLTVDGRNAPAGGYNISFLSCQQCWVSNIRSLAGGRAHVNTFMSARAEIRDSYFFGTMGGSNQSYGIETGEPGGSDMLIENNIFQGIAGPVVAGGGWSGNVIAYNFSINDVYSPSTFLQQSYPSHDAGDMFNLYEGNILAGLSCDDIHGTAGNVDTYFRNWLNGLDWNSGTENNWVLPAAAHPYKQTFPIELDSFCRGVNIIGNVLGTPTYHTTYQYAPTQTPSGAQCQPVIYVLGYVGGECDNDGTDGGVDDARVLSSLMRWGNYDTVNAAVRWDATESSPAASTYIAAQSTPASHALPASFYLSGKPSFFSTPQGTMPFPLIGPDITGGNGGTFSGGTYAQGICKVGASAGGGTCSSSLAGLVNVNPAMNCYFNVLNGPADGSGGALAFNATSCYYSTTSAPVAPTGVSALGI